MKKIPRASALSFLLSVSLLLNSCSSVPDYYRPSQGALSNVRNLAVVMKGDSTFKVLMTRTEQPMGSAILFGAVGVAAMSAYNNSKDGNMEDKLASLAGGISCPSLIKADLEQALKGSGRIEQAVFFDEKQVPRVQDYDGVLELSVEEWGLRLINTESMKVVPYVIIKILLKDKSNKILWKEKEIEVGKSARFFDEYRNQEGLFEESVRTTVKDAAYRITSTLLYS